MDVGGGTVIKGNWEQISNDSIKLNTFEQPKKLRTTYSGKINPERTNIQIKIADVELPLVAAAIVINDQDYGSNANMNGIAEMKAQKIKTITYYYLNRKETIEIDNPDYNEIEITVKDLDIDAVQMYLTDKIMTIHNKKLFFAEGYFLKKTKMANKQWK
ncbi:hypothetical protein ABW636_21670 [Aquimarina sp. 2201CG1-2-11]|uniref:hypothetical protein n=1 Tax=Aquimarina discodermiae TaxID=3231043 RepID=UPI003461F3E3